MSEIERRIKQAAESAVLKFIGDGNWLMPNYESRIRVPQDLIQEAWDQVDTGEIVKQLSRRLEAELADRVVNAMAQEIATDIKQILSVKEHREKIRNVAREHLHSIASKQP